MKLNSVSRPVAATESEPVLPRALVETVQTDAPPLTPADGKLPSRLAIGGSDTPLKRKSALESIIGATDERTRIQPTTDAPWRMICALEIDGPWGGFVGTGWLVGPRTIITAGHCVFDANQMGGWARSITVTPGRNGTDKPFGSFVATRFSTTDRWQQAQDADFDMAAIHVEPANALPASHGWFAVGSFPNEALMNQFVNVSGYPSDKASGAEQWWARNRIKAATPRRIFYDVDTMGGQSGAPAYIVPAAGAAPVVVGIHAYGVGGTSAEMKADLNSAPRLIPEVVEIIDGWRKADGGV